MNQSVGEKREGDAIGGSNKRRRRLDHGSPFEEPRDMERNETENDGVSEEQNARYEIHQADLTGLMTVSEHFTREDAKGVFDEHVLEYRRRYEREGTIVAAAHLEWPSATHIGSGSLSGNRFVYHGDYDTVVVVNVSLGDIIDPGDGIENATNSQTLCALYLSQPAPGNSTEERSFKYNLLRIASITSHKSCGNLQYDFTYNSKGESVELWFLRCGSTTGSVRSLVARGNFPVPKDLKNGAYGGYTITGKAVVKNGDEYHVATGERFKPCVDAVPNRRELVTSPAAEKIMDCIYKALYSNTILGVPLFEVLRCLSDMSPVEMPIAVVGGAVRDAIAGNKINDIDLAIGRTWNELEEDIRKLFAQRGKPLNDGNFITKGKHKRFGMMKILKSDGDNDHVDIGLFKSDFSDIPGDKCEYIFGYSYERDAGMRDYSINAVYVDVRHRRLIDPFKGLDCMLDCAPDAKDFSPRQPMMLEFIAQNRKKDLGGRFRLFKHMHEKRSASGDEFRYSIEEPEAKRIVGMLLEEAEMFLSSPSHYPDAQKWLMKLVEKLFKMGRPVSESAANFRRAALRLKELDIPGIAGLWNSVIDLAKRWQSIFPLHFCDRGRDAQLALAMEALKVSAPLDEH